MPWVADADSVLLWLWLWPAAVAPIRPLAREPLCAEGADLKRQKKKRRQESDYSGLGCCGGMCSIPGPAQWVKGSSMATAAV